MMKLYVYFVNKINDIFNNQNHIKGMLMFQEETICGNLVKMHKYNFSKIKKNLT